MTESSFVITKLWQGRARCRRYAFDAMYQSVKGGTVAYYAHVLPPFTGRILCPFSKAPQSLHGCGTPTHTLLMRLGGPLQATA